MDLAAASKKHHSSRGVTTAWTWAGSSTCFVERPGLPAVGVEGRGPIVGSGRTRTYGAGSMIPGGPKPALAEKNAAGDCNRGRRVPIMVAEGNRHVDQTAGSLVSARPGRPLRPGPGPLHRHAPGIGRRRLAPGPARKKGR